MKVFVSSLWLGHPVVLFVATCACAKMRYSGILKPLEFPTFTINRAYIPGSTIGVLVEE